MEFDNGDPAPGRGDELAGEGPEGSEARLQLARRAGLASISLFAAAVLVAAAGGALLAWLIGVPRGVPFGRAWLIATLIVLGLPVVGQLLLALWRRRT